MNMMTRSCCLRSYTSVGLSHNQHCIDRKKKWVIRRDNYCLDASNPWTVYHYAGATRSYMAWASAATFEEAMRKTDAYVRAYTATS